MLPILLHPHGQLALRTISHLQVLGCGLFGAGIQEGVSQTRFKATAARPFDDAEVPAFLRGYGTAVVSGAVGVGDEPGVGGGVLVAHDSGF